jgi:hypothetical protein
LILGRSPNPSVELIVPRGLMADRKSAIHFSRLIFFVIYQYLAEERILLCVAKCGAKLINRILVARVGFGLYRTTAAMCRTMKASRPELRQIEVR